MQERRKSIRKQAHHPLAVTDRDRDALLGYLVDISSEGIMVLSPEAIPTNRVFQLGLELPADIDCGPAALFGAESLWTESSSELEKYWIGFQIIDIAPEHAQKIRRLIDAL